MRRREMCHRLSHVCTCCSQRRRTVLRDGDPARAGFEGEIADASSRSSSTTRSRKKSQSKIVKYTFRPGLRKPRVSGVCDPSGGPCDGAPGGNDEDDAERAGDATRAPTRHRPSRLPRRPSRDWRADSPSRGRAGPTRRPRPPPQPPARVRPRCRRGRCA